jgi:CRP-like cAMP-binding protein
MSVTLDALQQVPFMSHVNRKQLEGLAETMSERQVDAGKDIVTQGSGGVAFFLLIEGNATVIVDGEDRRQLGPGDHFGEIALIVPDAPRTSTVRADSEVRVAALTAWNFKPWVMKNPEVAWALLETLAQRFVTTPHT